MAGKHKTTGARPRSQEELSLMALLEEYTSLRKESIAAIGYRIQIITFTFAALSVIVAGLLAGKVSHLLAGFMSLIVVPQIAKASLLMWLGEYHRSVRAGRYLRSLEKNINSIIPEPHIGWETHLTMIGEHINYPHVATAFLILLVGYLASALGIYLLFRDSTEAPNQIILAFLVVYVLLLEVIFFVYFYTKWRRIRRDQHASSSNSHD